MIIRRPTFDPCHDGDLPLVGAWVVLYDAFRNEIARTVTDADGYYTFTDLPMGRYYVNIHYPRCSSLLT